MSGALNVLIGELSAGTSGAPVPTLVASIDNDSPTGFILDGGTCTSQLVTVSASGGVPPYTYSWAYVSGDVQITATDPTSNQTRFTRYFPVPFADSSKVAHWTCTVEDVGPTGAAIIPVVITLDTIPSGGFL